MNWWKIETGVKLCQFHTLCGSLHGHDRSSDWQLDNIAICNYSAHIYHDKIAICNYSEHIYHNKVENQILI